MNVTQIVTPDLLALRSEFRKHGHEIRLVGGCVRDLLMGLTPKDVDLHTDATPEECVAIYKATGVRFEETGTSHGTISVIFDHVAYEITSLRTDVETDGRHATVAYTRDGGMLDPDLLEKFKALGYNADEEYDVAELTRIFQRINQSS